MSKLLLKCRPTVDQIKDRIRPPLPDGLELYLDVQDISSESAIEGVAERVLSLTPAGYCYVVEGPVRSLDGAFFDLTRWSDADRELVRRLVRLALKLGARVVNIHAIAPSPDVSSLTSTARLRALDRSIGLLSYYVETAIAVGLIPAIENIPPIQRQREERYFFSPIGMAPEDLMFFVERLPGLKLTLDVSHAQLYINLRRYATGGDDQLASPSWLRPLRDFVHLLAPVGDIFTYGDTLDGKIVVCHLSNASGLLGEGLPFGQGDLDMDALTRWMCTRAEYLVTETLEPDPAHAIYMRDAQRRIAQALQESDEDGDRQPVGP